MHVPDGYSPPGTSPLIWPTTRPLTHNRTRAVRGHVYACGAAVSTLEPLADGVQREHVGITGVDGEQNAESANFRHPTRNRDGRLPRAWMRCSEGPAMASTRRR
jgi:hypothetical protein